MNNLLKSYFFLIVLSVLFSINSTSQNIAINEIMSSNSNTIADENGDYEDWIEIYNYGTTAVNLNGFGLSDQTDNPLKWTFPNITIPAKGYLLIWASDKNRRPTIGQLHTNYKLKSGGKAIILSNASGTKI